MVISNRLEAEFEGSLLNTYRVLLQKTVSIGAVQIENDGLVERYLYTGTHEAIISDEMFMNVKCFRCRKLNTYGIKRFQTTDINLFGLDRAVHPQTVMYDTSS